MFVARRLLFAVIVVLSFLHSTTSRLCLCTLRDEIQLYNDVDLKSELITIPARNTCFLGTKLTEKQDKTNGTYVSLESLALGTCGDSILDSEFLEWSHGEQILNAQTQHTKDDIAKYYGNMEDFFERSYGGTRKRFLTGVIDSGPYWSDWSDWNDCITVSCNVTGYMMRNRTCVRTNLANGGICTGKSNEILQCSTSCETNKPIGWSSWMEWSDCDSNNCLFMQTTRTRKCFQENKTCIGPSSETKDCTQDLCAVDGVWTEWSPWSNCSRSGDGFMKRLRTCTNPKPSHGGSNCPGKYWEIKMCQQRSGWAAWEQWGACRRTANEVYIQFRNRSCVSEDLVNTNESSCNESKMLDYRTCQSYGTWTNWGSWSDCSLSQNQGTKIRNRTCITDNAVDHICIGNSTEEIPCTDQTSLLPNEWSAWSDCKWPCNGSSKRQRQCDDPHPSNCSLIEEYRNCTPDICQVDGNWASWSEWDTCENVAELSYRVRTRNCTDPPPKNGGIYCNGKSSGVELCNQEPEWGNWQEWEKCLPVAGTHGVRFRYRFCHAAADGTTCNGTDFENEKCLLQGTWLDWADWSVCSVTCESGVLTRTRICNMSEAIQLCEGNSTEEKPCHPSPHCPVDGGYTPWTEWSSCPVTCGEGPLSRYRDCTSPSPGYGGKNCSSLGPTSEASFCNAPCPVDGQWSDWGPWASCSATCGYGTMSRIRACSNPPASDGGQTCEGTDSSIQNCTLPLCSVDGGWSQWSNWSQCSCEKQHTRHRDCNNPTPVENGHYCVGSATEVASCEPNPHLTCPIDGAWAEWLDWSTKCSVTCSQGVVARFRQCANPQPQYGGQYCKGALSDKKPCIQPECPRDGVWASWSGWNTCSVTCGNGTQVRGRQCDPPPMYGGANCTGDYQDTKDCVQNPCPINGEWSDWETWSRWDSTCSFATRSRTRKCDRPVPQYNGLFCVGEKTDSESGDLGHCPVDGNWGSWHSWTPCSVTCENGTRTRSRDCDTPEPQFNGSYCVGNQTETDICSDRPSCVIDGNWGTWFEWYGCDVTCGTGTNIRYRACSNPRPQNGGEPCSGGFSEINNCTLVECPINGGWSQWAAWNACSVTCASGTQTRSRTCSHPIPRFGGMNCQGNITDIQSCDFSPCPIDGSWSEWQGWSSCSATCGNTTKVRSRTCNNPLPQYNGSDCQGQMKEITVCILTPCPIDGGYGEWQAWEACDVTCSNGTRLRHRLCDSPAPQYGGNNCVGTNETSGPCNERNCPVDGGWSIWQAWSPCKGNCDNAMHQRARDCASPVPADGGAFCEGDQVEVLSCLPDDCLILTSAPPTLSTLTTQPTTTTTQPTITTTQPTTTTTQPTTTTTRPTTRVSTTLQPTTAAATTPSVSTSTKASAKFNCYTCDGPVPEFCLTMMKPVTCPEPYCINELTNSVNGDKIIDRRCGTKLECDKDWWTTTSDNDKCTLYDDTQTVTNYIHCTFCCKDEYCNKPTVPTSDSLYKPNI